jgi:hypothetical protein
LNELTWDEYLNSQKKYLKSIAVDIPEVLDSIGKNYFRLKIITNVLKQSPVVKSFSNFKPSTRYLHYYESKKINWKTIETCMHELGHMLEKFDSGYKQHLFHVNMTLDSRPYTYEHEMTVNQYAYCVYRLIVLNYIDWCPFGQIPISGWTGLNEKTKLMSNEQCFNMLKEMYNFLYKDC